VSLKVTAKQIKKLLNHLLNNPLSGGVVGDVRDEACEIIATNIESHGSNTSLPSAAETDAVIGAGAIPNMVKSGGSMGIGEVTSLRNGGKRHFSTDPERLSDLIQDPDVQNNTVKINPIDWIHRKKRFVLNSTSGVAELEDDEHDVNFVECWLGGFTMYNKGHVPAGDDYIQGRDIVRSAVLMSIEDIMNKFKELMEQELYR